MNNNEIEREAKKLEKRLDKAVKEVDRFRKERTFNSKVYEWNFKRIQKSEKQSEEHKMLVHIEGLLNSNGISLTERTESAIARIENYKAKLSRMPKVRKVK